MKHPDLIQALVPTLLEAGKAIMDVFNTDFDVTEKEDNSPVTLADKRGEDIITAALRVICPDIQIIGEEAISDGVGIPALENRFFLVDPLDGTKEFIKRGSDFTVNIGLIEDGKPVLGLVLAPALGQLWAGAEGFGAFSAKTDLEKVLDKKTLSTRTAANPLTIVASKSHRSPALEKFLAHFSGAKNISIGSSLKLVLIAEGSADLYPRIGPTCEWDTAAADAILRAAGGLTLTGEGASLIYGKNPETFLNPYFLCKGDPTIQTPNF